MCYAINVSESFAPLRNQSVQYSVAKPVNQNELGPAGVSMKLPDRDTSSGNVHLGSINLDFSKIIHNVGNFLDKTVYRGGILPAGRFVGRYVVPEIAADKAIKRGDWNEAIKACNVSLGQHTSSYQGTSYDTVNKYSIFDVKGYAYIKKGDYDQSILNFSKAIEQYPSDAFAYQTRAYAYDKQGNNKQASSDYSQAMKLKSDEAKGQLPLPQAPHTPDQPWVINLSY